MNEYIVPIHVLGVIFALYVIIRADKYGFSWIRGRVQVLDAKVLHKFHYQAWAALCFMIVTGLTLFYPIREFLLSRPEFYIKMSFVFALIVNGLVIGHLQTVAIKKSFASLQAKEKIPLFISGAVSTISWLGAFITAFFLIPD
jgi:uncharacterized membrane protein